MAHHDEPLFFAPPHRGRAVGHLGQRRIVGAPDNGPTAASMGWLVNAQSLVQALRSGTPITLADGTGAGSTVNNPSRPLGYGEIAIALGLAQQSLAAQGITSPRPPSCRQLWWVAWSPWTGEPST